MKSYVVIGLGRFGSEVAIRLSQLGNEVLVMDTDSEVVQKMSGYVTQAVIGDGRDKAVLHSVGVGNFDCAIVAIGHDLSASILACMNLKELGVPYLVCKAHDEVHRKVLTKLGADRVVIPEQENACRLAKSLSSPNVLDYIELSPEYGIVEIPVPASWTGRTLKELDVRAKIGVNIIAIRRDGKIQVSPSADFRIAEADIVVVLGNDRQIAAMEKQ